VQSRSRHTALPDMCGCTITLSYTQRALAWRVRLRHHTIPTPAPTYRTTRLLCRVLLRINYSVAANVLHARHAAHTLQTCSCMRFGRSRPGSVSARDPWDAAGMRAAARAPAIARAPPRHCLLLAGCRARLQVLAPLDLLRRERDRITAYARKSPDQVQYKSSIGAQEA
jgi:hypothetical protein